MNKVGWSVGAAAATWIGLGYVYRGAEYAAAGPVELETDVMRAILTIAAFFVPMLVGKFNPALGELLKKLFARFMPEVVSAPPSAMGELTKLTEIALHCAEMGDEDGVKRCCDLHKHLLEAAAKKNASVQWDPVQTC